jgi:general secretion pathway protein J
VRPLSPPRQGFGREAGFTLLEILVVVVVLGLLVIGLAQGVRAGVALWNAQSRRVGETAELDAAARVLRALLSGIAGPASAGLAGGVAPAELKGSAEMLAFVGDLPTGLGTMQRANITLMLSRGRLVLRWTPHRHELSEEPAPKPSETELVHNVSRLDLAYWGASSPERGKSWVAQWDGPAAPDLIRVRLGFAKDDHRRFPDLIAAPQP